MLSRPRAPLPLALKHLDLLSLRASGHTMPSAATLLRRTVGTLYNRASECNRRLGVSGPEAAVHVCYLARILPRPDLAEHTVDLGWEDLELWRLLAAGATVPQIADALDLCTSTISCRIKDLLRRTRCTSRPQLVTRGWSLELRSGWAQFEDAGPARQVQMLQQHAWVSLWVAGCRSRALSLTEIGAAAKVMFATDSGAAFWRWAHHWYGALACDTRALGVYEVLDEIYADESGETVSEF
ncbi:DUF6082 family protein [Streptomyces sp. NPDC048442]|uniref:DUF6082 family protein n=1 Tax=Streptomyces sp. NPDC048442 TaxID=3154823 RepID=UPI00342C9FB1